MNVAHVILNVVVMILLVSNGLFSMDESCTVQDEFIESELLSSLVIPHIKLTGHESAVYSVAFSPDGNQLASGSTDKTTKLWNRQTGTCIKTFKGYGNAVYSVAFSPDGNQYSNQLASGSNDGTIKLWDLQRANRLANKIVKLWDQPTACIKTFNNHEAGVLNHGGVLSIAFSPDGNQLANGLDCGIIKLWNRRTGACIYTFNDHVGWVRAVAFSPDGNQLASGSADRTIKLWNLQTGTCTKTLSGDKRVSSVAFSSDGNQLVSGVSKTIKLWNLQTCICIHTFNGHSSTVFSVALSPDDAQLASGSNDRTIKLWDLQTRTCIKTLNSDDTVLSVAFSSDGNQLASGSYDGIVRVWDLRKFNNFRTKLQNKSFTMEELVLFAKHGI